MKTIFAYLRDSGGPAQERSVPEQRQALQAWADEQGYLIARCVGPAWPSSPSTTTFLTARWPTLSNR